MTTALAHVTLDTAHTHRSLRADAREDSIALLRASLSRALQSSGTLAAVPYRDGYAYLATVERAGLLVTLVRSNAGGSPSPIVTFGVAVDDSYADLWALLHRKRGGMPDGAVHQTEPSDPPAPPWLAVRLEVGATSVPPADLLWMADFERTMAWAWLEIARAAG
jgi:hypothetical protein